MVKIDEYVGFCLHRRSYLLGSPVLSMSRGHGGGLFHHREVALKFSVLSHPALGWVGAADSKKFRSSQTRGAQYLTPPRKHAFEGHWFALTLPGVYAPVLKQVMLEKNHWIKTGSSWLEELNRPGIPFFFRAKEVQRTRAAKQVHEFFF